MLLAAVNVERDAVQAGGDELIQVLIPARLEQAEEAYRLFDTQTTGKAVILPS